MILVSACLAGCHCRYDGSSREVSWIAEWVAQGRAIPVCPEQLGGLPTPRPPAQIVGGEGGDVLDGRAKVFTQAGDEVSESFVRGAEETLHLARLVRASAAVLKERSPSCGSGLIYDGTFTGKARPGRGVTAALLDRHGIPVYSEDEGPESVP